MLRVVLEDGPFPRKVRTRVSRLVIPSAIVPSPSGLLPVMNGPGSYQLLFLCEASYGNVKTLELREDQAGEVLGEYAMNGLTTDCVILGDFASHGSAAIAALGAVSLVRFAAMLDCRE